MVLLRKTIKFLLSNIFFLRKISEFYKFAKAKSPASRFQCPVSTIRKFPVFFATVDAVLSLVTLENGYSSSVLQS
jgi:hypothetical protein